MKLFKIVIPVFLLYNLFGCAAKMSTEAGGVTVDTGNPIMDILGLTFIIIMVYWAKKALDFRYWKKEQNFIKKQQPKSGAEMIDEAFNNSEGSQIQD